MRLAVEPCSVAHRARAAGQIARASSTVELWLLRASLYQYLAQDMGQVEAGRRMAAILALFNGAVPGTVAGAVLMREIADNRAHEQRVY